jgi:GNAT superfamily N-acetyltransferase
MNESQKLPPITLRHRVAKEADIEAIKGLMRASITENMKAFLSASEIEAAKETMGVDKTLIEDGTYFLIEVLLEDERVLVGCGGWGKRKTLYGGDHTVGRDDSFSDPSLDAARIRAMYTHPNWIRRGIGTLLLDLGENAARQAGFKTIELGSTVPGEPLYLARGYVEVERKVEQGANGSDNTVIKMVKPLAGLDSLAGQKR